VPNEYGIIMDVVNQVKNSSKSDKGKSQSSRRNNNSISDILQTANGLRQIQGKFSPGRILAITIGGIALAEVIAMIVVYYYKFLPYYLQIILDAAIMLAIIFPLLYLLSFRPLLQHIQQRHQSESIIQARLRLMEFANTHTLDELLQVALDETEALTGSTVSFFHFLEADQKTLWLQSWSTNTLQNMCNAEGKDSHYDVEQAGVWADCVRHRQPIIHNDYASLPHRKGMPEGHALVIREMAVPIMRDTKIVGILGLGNKPQNYTTRDLEVVSTFADFAWDIVEYKRAENALLKSEEKFRTLVEWTYDWEKWMDPQGNILYISPSCKRITGYSPEEFIADPDLLIRIIHPNDRRSFEEHHRVVHDESAGVKNIEYRIIARDGSEHWIDHVCRPLFGQNSRYLGRRVSNRDITERKKIEKVIREHNQKEKILTQTIHTMQIDIARDLHDTLGQNISYLRLKLDHLSDAHQQKQTDMQTEIKSMSKVANESYDLIRGTLAVLQIDGSNNLLHLFTRHAEQVEERSKIKIDFTSNGEPRSLSANQMRQLFYIFREALSNIEKHAIASKMTISLLWEESYLILGVVDNGQGVDLTATQDDDHYGVRFMRERAELLKGSISIDSVVGEGTNIIVKMPYEA
jgi:PAS domain S-box-containing protein